MKNGILTLLLNIILILICPFDILTNNLNPLIFGISFCIVNKKLLKNKLIIGLLLSIIGSYIAFFIGLLGLFGIAEIGNKITEIFNLKSINGNVYIIFSGLLASLSLYLLYTKIYVIKNTKSGFKIMLLSYLLVPILTYLIPVIFKDVLISQFFVNYNLAWIVLVSFFLSFSINFYAPNEKITVEKNNE